MNSSKYYHRFGHVLNTPLTRFYLRWAYQNCLNDLSRYQYQLDFSKPDFTALLCGVGHESTASVFIDFVLSKNKKATIYIIDLGKHQINAVNQLVRVRYPHARIKTYQINALKLESIIGKQSIHWIETDGFIEYFDSRSLVKLFHTWKNILQKDGCITFRDCITANIFDSIFDKLRLWLAKQWLDVDLYVHTQQEFSQLVESLRMRYTTGPTGLPTYHRYSLIRNAKT